MAVAMKLDVLRDVRGIVESTIKLSADRLDIDAEFPDLGIDSIIAMELMENLSRHFAIAFTPAQFLNVNTVRELASFIEDHYEVGSVATDGAESLVDTALSPAGELPLREADNDDTSLHDLLETVKTKYAIDLTGGDWRSIDEIVDEMVSNHLEQLVHRVDIDDVLPSPRETASPSPAASRDVAIVGLSCRFPDAPTPQAFWDNLVNRKNSIREVPASRWHWQDYYSETAAPGRTVSKWGAMIEDVDCFDPQFFNLRPEEAKLIDPQERLLMQEVYRAIQDAGMDIRKLAGSNTGVFVGYEYAEYEQYLRANLDKVPGLVCSSSSPTYYLANRLSFVFDFCGPSESVNVNCASSAVAINRACLSLINGESDLAIAGAACLHLFAGDYVTSSQYGLLSPNGTCAVFDNDANGFTRGEGVGAIVLKRLDMAIADNDRIYGVIKASHQGNRGGANTLSDVKHEAITEVINRCYEKAAVTHDSVNYIEVNGYAKKWADSFEFEGIKNAFQDSTLNGKTCALGSLKGNVGHMEPVNGVASVIKVALSLHNKRFPPTITRNTASSFIDFSSAAHPLYLADAEIPFDSLRKSIDAPIRAGVSSFADSGVNVHILMEEFIPQPRPRQIATAQTSSQLVVLSAKDPERLTETVKQFIDFLSDDSAATSLTDLAYTLQVGREAMAERVAVVASSLTELREKFSLLLQAGFKGSQRLEERGVYRGSTQPTKDNSLVGLITADMTRRQLDLGLQTNDWSQIARLWTHGVDVPWDVVWRGTAASRISLPAYPFAKVRCWIDIEGGGYSANSAVTPASAATPVAAMTHQATTPDRRWQFTVGEAPHPNDIAMTPVDKAMLLLRHEIAVLQQRELADIESSSNLVDLGMNSLAIADLITRVSNLLGINLSPSAIFRYPEIDRLAGYLAQQYSGAVAALSVRNSETGVDSPTDHDRSVVATKVPQAISSGDPDILIPMHPQGSGTPVFVVPGADGSVLSLKSLCDALGEQRPVFGLEAVGLDGTSALPSSVAEIAACNIKAMRKTQPLGPYHLLGYSNGGVVAFEMARLLINAGERVESLVLLDSLCPPVRKSSELQLVAEVFTHLVSTMGGNISLDAERLERLPEDQRSDYLYGLMTAQGLDVAKDYFAATYQVATSSERLCRAYPLSKLTADLDVTLIRAIEGYRDVPADYGWNSFLSRPVRCHDIGANHYTVMDDVHARTIVELIAMLPVAPSTAGRTEPQTAVPGKKSRKPDARRTNASRR